MFGQKVRPGGYLLFGFFRQTAHIIKAFADTQPRISLYPDRLIERFIIFIQRINGREKSVILHYAPQYLDGVIPQFVADAFAVKSRCGDRKQQGLQAGTGPGFQHIPHITGFVGVKFVHNAAVNVQAIEVICITGQWLKLGCRPLLVNRQFIKFKQAAE